MTWTTIPRNLMCERLFTWNFDLMKWNYLLLKIFVCECTHLPCHLSFVGFFRLLISDTTVWRKSSISFNSSSSVETFSSCKSNGNRLEIVTSNRWYLKKGKRRKMFGMKSVPLTNSLFFLEALTFSCVNLLNDSSFWVCDDLSLTLNDVTIAFSFSISAVSLKNIQ